MSTMSNEIEGEDVHQMFDNDMFSQEPCEEVSGSEEEQDTLLQKALSDALVEHPQACIKQGKVVYPRNPNKDEGLYYVYSECIKFKLFIKNVIADGPSRQIPVEVKSKGKAPGTNKKLAISEKWSIFNYCPGLAKRKQTTMTTPTKKKRTLWDDIQPERLSKDIFEEVSQGKSLNTEKIDPNCAYNAKRVFGNMFMMHRDTFSAKSQNFDVLSERGRPAKVRLDPIKPFIDLFQIGALYKGDPYKCLIHLDREMLYSKSGYIFNNVLNYKGTALRCKLDYWLTPEMLEYSKRICDSVNAKQCIFGHEGKDVELDEASEIYDMYK